MNIIAINKNISYIEHSENPLSADVGIINDNGVIWLYDVGTNSEIPEYLRDSYNVVISHFHQDHTGNLNDININNLYLGNESYRHFHFGNIVNSDIYVGNVHIFPLPSTHAKGSLALEYGDYVFTGDGLYSRYKDGCRIYNVQLLKQAIDILINLKANYVLTSHYDGLIRNKSDIIKELQDIYAHRVSSSSEIRIPVSK